MRSAISDAIANDLDMLQLTLLAAFCAYINSISGLWFIAEGKARLCCVLFWWPGGLSTLDCSLTDQVPSCGQQLGRCVRAYEDIAMHWLESRVNIANM